MTVSGIQVIPMEIARLNYIIAGKNTMNFDCWIPLLPPGINRTYGKGRGRVYLTHEARAWSKGAALVIGAEAGRIGWEDYGGDYEIQITMYGSRLDVDAPIKLIIDTVTRKLGFDDSRVIMQSSKTVRDTDKEGAQIVLRELKT